MTALIILSLVFGLHIFGILCASAPVVDGSTLPPWKPRGLAGSLAAGAFAVIVLAAVGGV